MRRARKRSSRLPLLLLLSVSLVALAVFISPLGSSLRTQIIVGAPDQNLGAPVISSSAADRIIDNQQPNNQEFSLTSGRSGWTYDQAGGYLNDFHSSFPGRGENTATWTFSSLPPGQYQVFATWTANRSNAASASYTVSDGQTTLLTAAVNQSSAPRTDSTAGGTSFQSLGNPVTANTGALTVTLTNAARGYVVADAVWVQQMSEAALASIIANETVGACYYSGNLCRLTTKTACKSATDFAKFFFLPNKLCDPDGRSEFAESGLSGYPLFARNCYGKLVGYEAAKQSCKPPKEFKLIAGPIVLAKGSEAYPKVGIFTLYCGVVFACKDTPAPAPPPPAPAPATTSPKPSATTIPSTTTPKPSSSTTASPKPSP